MALMQSRRGPRSTFTLGTQPGVYALFLRNGAELPNITPGTDGLLYIGLAANRKGLLGRCHFAGQTRNHSPRKSLGALLKDELNLVPVLISKPNSRDTWGLDAASDARLTGWMHENLDFAIELCADPTTQETELIARHTPPLNLTKCPQTAQHRLISNARATIMAEVSSSFVLRSPLGTSRPVKGAEHYVGAEIDTANAIAARYGLNPKSYRQRLRETITWYRKPQDWTFPVDTPEWRDMIAVAKRMRG